MAAKEFGAMTDLMLELLNDGKYDKLKEILENAKSK